MPSKPRSNRVAKTPPPMTRPYSKPAARAAAGFVCALGMWTVVPPCVAANLAYVTNQGGQTVSVVDLETLTVTATIPVPGKPAGISVSPVRPEFYATAPDAHDIAVIDQASNTVVRRIQTGGGPVGIAAHPISGLIYVADWYTHQIAVADPQTGAVLSRIDVGQSPSGVAITPDGATILTADRDSDAVSLIDAATNTRLASIKVGARPFGITLDAQGTRAFTANVGSDDVSVIDLKTRSVIATVPVGRRPYAVAVTSDQAFVTDQYGGTVTVFDLATMKPVKTIEACDHPEGINYDAGRNAVYVACWFDNTLIRIDTTSLTVTGSVRVGDGPRAFGNFLR